MGAEENKQLALKAFDALFNRHDFDAAATMWSEGYIQHSTHIGPGRNACSSVCGRFQRRFGTRTLSLSPRATMWCSTVASRAKVNRGR